MSRAVAALLLSFGVSSVVGLLRCFNDDLVAVETPAIALPAYVKRQESKPVDVYFHVTSTVANKDRITDAVVDAQVRLDDTSRRMQMLTENPTIVRGPALYLSQARLRAQPRQRLAHRR